MQRQTILKSSGIGFVASVLIGFFLMNFRTTPVSPATGVGSVFSAKVQQEVRGHRQPLSLRTLARVLRDCDEKGNPIHPGFIRWASRSLPPNGGEASLSQISGNQLFGQLSVQSL
jgi:hypothetical protein